MASVEAVEAAKKWLLDNNKNFSFTANFASFDKNGKLVKEYLNQPCHASFSNSVGKLEVIATELDTKKRRKKSLANPESVEEKDLRVFINWLVNDSIYSPCIVTKDVDEIIEMGGIVISLHNPSPTVMSSLIIARYPYERPGDSFKVFCGFIEKGYNPCVSAYVAFNTNMCDIHNNDYLKKTLFCATSGHRALNVIDMDSLRKMVKKEAGKEVKGTCTESKERSMYGTFTYYFDDNKVHRKLFTKELVVGDKELQSIIRQYRGESTDVYRPPNPFDTSRPKKLNPWDVTCQEVIDVVMPYMKEKGII